MHNTETKKMYCNFNTASPFFLNNANDNADQSQKSTNRPTKTNKDQKTKKNRDGQRPTNKEQQRPTQTTQTNKIPFLRND